MTSQTKVGLLIGLVLIFTVTFVLRGIPGLADGSGDNEVKTFNFDRLGDRSIDLRRQADEAVQILDRVEQRTSVNIAKIDNAAVRSEDVRYVVDLPAFGGSDVAQQNQGSIVLSQNIQQAENGGEAEIFNNKPIIYVVQQGDNLASIAKRFYGDEQGNKKKTIDMIYHANMDKMESVDKLFAGQELVIPSIPEEAGKATILSTIFDNNTFEKVKSIGRKPFSMASTTIKERLNSKKEYVVESGDSLWKIAQRELGNGSRFEEIAALNADVLSDEDSLFVGLKLKLPSR